MWFLNFCRSLCNKVIDREMMDFSPLFENEIATNVANEQTNEYNSPF